MARTVTLPFRVDFLCARGGIRARKEILTQSTERTSMSKIRFTFVVLAMLGFLRAANADTVQYTSSPGSYPAVTTGLIQEFGTATFPPLSETALSYYQVQGSGPVTLTFRFHFD